MQLRLNKQMAVCPCGGTEFTVDPKNYAYKCDDCFVSWFVGVDIARNSGEPTIHLIEVK